MADAPRYRFSFVLAALLVYWAVAPLLQDFIGIKILTDIFFSIILVSAVYAVSRVRLHTVLAAGLALPMFVSVWMLHFADHLILRLTGSLFEVLFFGYTAGLFLSAVLAAARVSREVISAAIVVYMFLGLIWAGLYSTLEILSPGSFAAPAGGAGPNSHYFTYFSFTTLTTLGYGDITPFSGPARAFATLEALVGQIYLTVLIARLVGIHISQSSN